MINLRLGNCIEILSTLCGDKDMVYVTITDPPYGVGVASWDNRISPELWMITNGCISFGVEPFTSWLITHAPKEFKYDLIWHKNNSRGSCAKFRPRITHEQVLIFGNLLYNDIRDEKRTKEEIKRLNQNQRKRMTFRSPGSVLYFESINNRDDNRVHITQKPVELMEWLVLRYTNEGDTIIDPFMGSGTTGVACVQTGRNFIGIEIEPKYFEIAEKRIAEAQLQIRMEI